MVVVVVAGACMQMHSMDTRHRLAEHVLINRDTEKPRFFAKYRKVVAMSRAKDGHGTVYGYRLQPYATDTRASRRGNPCALGVMFHVGDVVGWFI